MKRTILESVQLNKSFSLEDVYFSWKVILFRYLKLPQLQMNDR